MSRQRPNVVFVLTDDQGYGDLGCHGNDVIRTPNLDRHHADGVRFTDFHVGTTCAPTRSGLLTGHDCNSAGVWHTIGGRSLLREDEWTLADALREAGYRTGHFGKWHLGDSQPFRPHERGFERSIYHAGGGIGNTGDPWGNDYFDDTYYVNGDPERFAGYCTDVFFREGLRFIEEHREEPFFCYIATNAPHTPLNVEPRYVERYRDAVPHEDRARFYGMITNIDENFGTLTRALEELGLADDTIVVFMTDNGTATGVELDADEHPREGPGSFNAGMRGRKGSPYEGGHRVPFLLRYAGGGAAGGRDVDTLTSYVDFMPTILDLCGLKAPAGRSFHGRSLLPLMRGEPGGDWAQRIVVSDTQRIARPMKWRKSSVMRGRWRLVNGTELYDLDRDPGQRTDVAAANPSLVAELRAGYDRWWEQVRVLVVGPPVVVAAAARIGAVPEQQLDPVGKALGRRVTQEKVEGSDPVAGLPVDPVRGGEPALEKELQPAVVGPEHRVVEPLGVVGIRPGIQQQRCQGPGMRMGWLADDAAFAFAHRAGEGREAVRAPPHEVGVRIGAVLEQQSGRSRWCRLREAARSRASSRDRAAAATCAARRSRRRGRGPRSGASGEPPRWPSRQRYAHRPSPTTAGRRAFAWRDRSWPSNRCRRSGRPDPGTATPRPARKSR